MIWRRCEAPRVRCRIAKPDKNRSSMCILDHDGKVVKEELIKGLWATVLHRLRSIEGPWSVCYEASCGYGYRPNAVLISPDRRPNC